MSLFPVPTSKKTFPSTLVYSTDHKQDQNVASDFIMLINLLSRNVFLYPSSHTRYDLIARILSLGTNVTTSPHNRFRNRQLCEPQLGSNQLPYQTDTMRAVTTVISGHSEIKKNAGISPMLYI